MASSASWIARMFRNEQFWQTTTLYRSGAPGRIRTHDPQIRSLVLYPAELPVLPGSRGIRKRGRKAIASRRRVAARRKAVM